VLASTPAIVTPEDIMRGNLPAGPVAIYDDDGYYLAAGLADKLREAGREVHFVTSAGIVAPWMSYTGDQAATHAHLLAQGIICHFNKSLRAFAPGRLDLDCVYGGAGTVLAVASLVPVTARQPETTLFDALQGDPAGLAAAGIRTLTRIGDAEAPGIIAHAVYAGHRFARNLGIETKRGAGRRDRGMGLAAAE